MLPEKNKLSIRHIIAVYLEKVEERKDNIIYSLFSFLLGLMGDQKKVLVLINCFFFCKSIKVMFHCLKFDTKCLATIL